MRLFSCTLTPRTAFTSPAPVKALMHACIDDWMITYGDLNAEHLDDLHSRVEKWNGGSILRLTPRRGEPGYFAREHHELAEEAYPLEVV